MFNVSRVGPAWALWSVVGLAWVLLVTVGPAWAPLSVVGLEWVLLMTMGLVYRRPPSLVF